MNPGPDVRWRSHLQRCLRFFRRNPTLVLGGAILAVVVSVAILAPYLVGDAWTMQPAQRFQPLGAEFPLGTDSLGRDVLARTVYGARISLLVGFAVAFIAIASGVVLGLLAGYLPGADAAIMHLMDGLMAIPAILLAIALVSLSKAGTGVVIAAIAVPEIPRVVRLVRAVVIGVRQQPFIEAAIAGGAQLPKILIRHVLPSTVPPLVVQASYIAASAILIEAALSFLGAGTPPEIPSWGNMIASSRLYLVRAPWTIFAPGIALAVSVLAINLIGDGLRDKLDPRLARRM